MLAGRTSDFTMDIGFHFRGDVLAAALFLVYLFIARTSLFSPAWRARTKGRALPPGPHRLPFIGNLLDMPKSQPWRGFRDLCLKYGEYRSTRLPYPSH